MDIITISQAMLVFLVMPCVVCTVKIDALTAVTTNTDIIIIVAQTQKKWSQPVRAGSRGIRLVGFSPLLEVVG